MVRCVFIRSLLFSTFLGPDSNANTFLWLIRARERGERERSFKCPSNLSPNISCLFRAKNRSRHLPHAGLGIYRNYWQYISVCGVNILNTIYKIIGPGYSWIYMDIYYKRFSKYHIDRICFHEFFYTIAQRLTSCYIP
jgi:hypothetical protein